MINKDAFTSEEYKAGLAAVPLDRRRFRAVFSGKYMAIETDDKDPKFSTIHQDSMLEVFDIGVDYDEEYGLLLNNIVITLRLDDFMFAVSVDGIEKIAGKNEWSKIYKRINKAINNIKGNPAFKSMNERYDNAGEWS